MKTYQITLLAAIVLLVSRNKKNNTKKTTINNSLETEQLIKNDSLFTILKDNLHTIAFNPILEGEKISEKNTSNKKTTAINKILVFNETNIHIEKDGFTEKIVAAEIMNSRFTFLDSIHIGIKKETLEKHLNTSLKSNLIQISNFNQTAVFLFKLNKGILKKIHYKLL